MATPPKLLCTLGQAWPVVPEAVLFQKGLWSGVHIITTSSESVKTAEIIEFLQSRFSGHFSLSRVENVDVLREASDHRRFEEVLFRWYLSHLGPDGALPVVCLSGGFKSISAAIQKAASLFGAREIFHVLADKVPQPAGGRDAEPQTVEQVLTAHTRGGLHYVSLGTEPGWSRLRALTASQFPLLSKMAPGASEQILSVGDGAQDLGRMIDAQLSQVARRSDAWENRAGLPFDALALIAPMDREWLQQPLDEATDSDWVRTLPKVELHCHLGGFATHGDGLEAVREAMSVPPQEWPDIPVQPPGWPIPGAPIGLDSYMKLGDANGTTLLKDPQALQRQCERLYAALQSDHVLYAEIRCSPNNYTDSIQRSAWTVLEEIRSAFQRCMDEAKNGSPCSPHVNLIVIATRRKSGDLSSISRHLALAITANQHHPDEMRCRVVGVDLAGFESVETRAAYFKEDFRAVHRCGLAVTAHAGENDDAEGIWQAVHDLHARRLGHALHLAGAPDLLRTIIERRIGIEMCPYANFQIKGFSPMAGVKTVYPLRDYLNQGVLVTVNTDNMGISAAALSDNLLLLAQLNPGITRMDILQLQANALAVAFAGHPLRLQLQARFNQALSRVFR